MQHAINHQTSADTATSTNFYRKDCKNFRFLSSNDFNNSCDCGDRAPLHWNANYDAPLEAIKALKKLCLENMLSTLVTLSMCPL